MGSNKSADNPDTNIAWVVKSKADACGTVAETHKRIGEGHAEIIKKIRPNRARK